MMRSTYTYAVLDLSPAAYEEIRQKLTDAGYGHAFHTGRDGRTVIDMRGIAVAASAAPATTGCDRCNSSVPYIEYRTAGGRRLCTNCRRVLLGEAA